MAKNHTSAECSECGAKFSVSCESSEEILFCPFCGDSVSTYIDPDSSDDEDEFDGFQDELDDTSDDE